MCWKRLKAPSRCVRTSKWPTLMNYISSLMGRSLFRSMTIEFRIIKNQQKIAMRSIEMKFRCVEIKSSAKGHTFTVGAAATAEFRSHWRVIIVSLSLSRSFSISNSLDSALITLIAQAAFIPWRLCHTSTTHTRTPYVEVSFYGSLHVIIMQA